MLRWTGWMFASLCVQFSAFLNRALACFSLSVCRAFDQKNGIQNIDSHQEFTFAVGRLKPVAPLGWKALRFISGSLAYETFSIQAFALQSAWVWRRLTCACSGRLVKWGFFSLLGFINRTHPSLFSFYHRGAWTQVPHDTLQSANEAVKWWYLRNTYVIILMLKLSLWSEAVCTCVLFAFLKKRWPIWPLLLKLRVPNKRGN